MKLAGKKLLLMISDGVDYREYMQVKKGFADEGAAVLITTPQNFLTVETLCDGLRGKDVLIDIPIESIEANFFDGLIVLGGPTIAEDYLDDENVIRVVSDFHKLELPIFASGNAVEILHKCRALSNRIVVGEPDRNLNFMNRAIEVLLENGKSNGNYEGIYRPTIAS